MLRILFIQNASLSSVGGMHLACQFQANTSHVTQDVSCKMEMSWDMDTRVIYVGPVLVKSDAKGCAVDSLYIIYAIARRLFYRYHS